MVSVENNLDLILNVDRVSFMIKIIKIVTNIFWNNFLFEILLRHPID